MRTAEEAAAELVTVEPESNGWKIRFDGSYIGTSPTPFANDCVELARRNLAAALSAFAAEAVAEATRAPTAGPADDSCLAEIRNHAAELQEIIDGGNGCLEQVLFVSAVRHIDFVEALLRDCGADGLLAVRQAGFRSGYCHGAAAMRERAAAMIDTLADQWKDEGQSDRAMVALAARGRVLVLQIPSPDGTKEEG